MKKYNLWLFLTATVVALIAATTVYAGARPTPREIGLQKKDLPSSAEIMIVDEFTPDTPITDRYHGLVDQQGNPWIIGYQRGYSIDILDTLTGSFIQNTVYEFKSAPLAKDQYEKWVAQLSTSPIVTSSIEIQNDRGIKAQKIIVTDPETGMSTYCFVRLRGNHLIFMFTDTIGKLDTGANPNSKSAKDVYNELANTLLDR